MFIRPETAADRAAIFDVTKAAFADHPYSQQTEQLIVDALRDAGALTISLVAEEDGKLVGHIAFSPVTITGDGGEVTGWYGLGPISVLPEHQGCGIGRALLEEGMHRLEGIGAAGCVLVGDPAFYHRFGFANRPELILEGVPAENFMARQLRAGEARGTVEFHPAFFVQA